MLLSRAPTMLPNVDIPGVDVDSMTYGQCRAQHFPRIRIRQGRRPATGTEVIMLKRHTAQPNALLGFLRSRPKAAGDSFRTNPRHDSSAPARISWEEPTASHDIPARLVNICRAGAALITVTPPPVGGTALIRIMGDEPTPWIEATILAAEPKDEKRFRVRLKFRELCPNIFLKAAVLAPPADSRSKKRRPPAENSSA